MIWMGPIWRTPAGSGGMIVFQGRRAETIARARREAAHQPEMHVVFDVGKYPGAPRFARRLEYDLHPFQVGREDCDVYFLVLRSLRIRKTGLGRAQSEGSWPRRVDGSCCVKDRHNH